GDMFVPRGTQRTDRAPHIPRWSHAPERVRAGGALRPVIANSHLTGRTIALEVTWKALGDLLSLQARLVLVENIQKTVADYCDVPLADLLPKRGRRLVARNQAPPALGQRSEEHTSELQSPYDLVCRLLLE